MSKLYRERNHSIDVLKGIGIISIVLGHALNTDIYFSVTIDLIRKFLYLFHITVFFYCGGCLFREIPFFKFLYNIIKNQYAKFVLIGIISLIFVPVWFSAGIIAMPQNILNRIINICFYKNDGILTGALWFVPFYSFSFLLFYLNNKVCSLVTKKRDFILAMLTLCWGVVGTVLVLNKRVCLYNMNEAMLMQPIIFWGYLTNKYKEKFEVTNWAWIVCLIFMVSANLMTGKQIELSKFDIYGGYLFYPLTFVSILFCISFTNWILTCKHISKIMEHFGRNSFDFMAFHFIGFKIFDIFIVIIDKNALSDKMTVFPIGFSRYRILYFIFGIIFSEGIIVLRYFVKRKLANGGELTNIVHKKIADWFGE